MNEKVEKGEQDQGGEWGGGKGEIKKSKTSQNCR